jgi:hypothetical protein
MEAKRRNKTVAGVNNAEGWAYASLARGSAYRSIVPIRLLAFDS